MILIIDFGSQTTHLIGRRIREMGVEVRIETPRNAATAIIKHAPKGIILSGGPSSVYGNDALLPPKEIFSSGLPVLGICYGLQIMAHMLGGRVEPGKKKEYGHTKLSIKKNSPLYKGINKESDVWMSHFDEVVKPPKGAITDASTQTIEVASFQDLNSSRFGVQFHPEVHHTKEGRKILENFVFEVCKEVGAVGKNESGQIEELIKKHVKGNAVLALSGGIDSAVAAVLSRNALGDRLTCIYVDTGMMREGETEEVKRVFGKNFKLNLRIIKAENIFLKALKGITDPEKKRKIIGESFIRVFEGEARKLKAEYLIQGTIYPDVIESRGTSHARKIKTHHNVGGIPSQHGFKIIEPLRNLYKDEVREIARVLEFPQSLITRHVYPGPGLAVRIIGEVTKRKLEILRKADSIVTSELKKAGLYESIWMGFAIYTGIKTTGVVGDERRYGETIAVRAIESKDTMTADWVKLPYDVLERISNRIVTEVFEVVRVVYDITTKPPGTMEWE